MSPVDAQGTRTPGVQACLVQVETWFHKILCEEGPKNLKDYISQGKKAACMTSLT